MKRKALPRGMVLVLLCVMILFPFPSALGAENFSNNPDAIEKAADSVLMLEVYSAAGQKIATGSGFVAFKDSLLITNYHVIEDGAYIVAISDEREQFLITRVCIQDKTKDIAILQFDEKTRLEPLELDGETKLKRAQAVVAIGSPAGLMNTVSIGNISAFYQRDGRDWIQFTAPISSGSSGGALFNDEGKVIGITTATYASTQNINMAVKAETVINLYRKWDGKSSSALSSKSVHYPSATGTQTVTGPSAGTNVNVYVTASGKKYHNNPTCSKMRNPIVIDLLEAIERGYEPCGKCYK